MRYNNDSMSVSWGKLFGADVQVIGYNWNGGWYLIIVFLGGLALTLAAYRRVPQGISPRLKTTLIALRLISLGLLLLLIAQPAVLLSITERERPSLVVLVDTSQSMNTRDGNSLTRLEAVKRALQSDALEQLRKSADVTLYQFAQTISPISQLSNFPVSSSNRRTFIGSALRHIVQEKSRRHTHPAAVVLFSDGQDNGDEDVLAAAKELNAPIYAVGVGSPRAQPDLAVRSVAALTAVFPGTLISVESSVGGNVGNGRRAVPVSLQEVGNGRRAVASKTVHLANQQNQTVTFELLPKGAGIHRYTVRVPPLPNEFITENNGANFQVNVVGRKLKVLYIEGYPRWEYKFLKRVLEEDKDIAFLALVGKPDGTFYAQGPLVPADHPADFVFNKKQLFGFDVIIFGDIAARQFTPAHLDIVRDFVEKRGGGFLMLGGFRSFGAGGYGGTPIEEILPVDVAQASRGPTADRMSALQVDKEFRWRLTPLAQTFPPLMLDENPQRNQQIWANLPPLSGGNIVGRVKANAKVYAEYPPDVMPRHGGDGAASRAILALHDYGRGKTAALTVDSTWRWYFEALKKGEDKGYFTRFWRQLLRQLANPDADRKVTLTLDRKRCEIGDVVTLTAYVKDENFDPARAANVSAFLRLPSGKREPLALHPDPQNVGTYVATYRPTQQGNYHITVSASVGGQKQSDETDFTVTSSFIELQDVALNEPLLQQLAAVTGGKYDRLSNYERLLDDLKLQGRTVSYRQAWHLSASPLPYAVLVLVLCGEWMLRRRNGLA
ncbi:MAG: glutamine amidotransferase [Abditibacteriales bacterium]|nr:glutamine amidotransferase [Abditibacteriales bacterium]